MYTVKFGTDGIRAIVNQGLTNDVAYKTGCALALFLREENKSPTVVVGLDTRKSGQMLQSALVSGLMCYGVNVVTVGKLSTPALAYITKRKQFDAGVMITASHNSHEYNGIKIFDKRGSKLSTQACLLIERYATLLDSYSSVKPEEIGQFSHNEKLLNLYQRFLYRNAIKFNKKVYIDCANGVTLNIAKRTFGNYCENLLIMGDSQVSEDVNKNCGATSTTALCKKVVESKSYCGFAFDGDGDRIIAVDENGKVVDGDDILIIIGTYLKEKHQLSHNTIVGTVMTNYGAQATLKELGINLVRVQVGDKYVQYEMSKNGYVLGGEQSGHIIIGNYVATGDGVFTALMLMKIMVESGKSLSELASNIKKFPQVLTNVQIAPQNKDIILESNQLKDVLERAEEELLFKGRVLVRASGTESLIRVLVEGESKSQIEKISEKIVKTIKELNLG